MPRIRTIKPDAFLSESLSSVPRGTRWTFAGLWTYADDAGRARDDVRLIKAALYPLDDDVTNDDVRADLILLAQIGGVCRYIVAGRSYLHMPNWEHQKINRPTPAKSPPCPLHEGGGSGHVLDPEPSVSPHGALTEPSRGEGKGREMDREGKGRDLSRERSAIEPDRFDEFWDAYGNKLDRKAAEAKWHLALKKPGVSAELLIHAAGEYAAYERTNENGRYVMGPAKWLLGERWRDERTRAAPQGRVAQHMALVRQLADEEHTQMPTPFPQIGEPS